MTEPASSLAFGVTGSSLGDARNRRETGRVSWRAILRWRGWPYVLFLVAALNVVTWFPSAQPIGWRDSGLLTFSYHPALLARVNSYPWNPLDGLGVPNANGIANLPFALWFWGASILGVAAGVAQGLLYYLLQACAMCLMYRLLLRLLDAQRGSSRAAACLGALFYSFSLLSLENYWMIGNASIALLPLIPAVLLAIEATVRGERWVPIAVRLGVVCACLLGAFENPAYALPLFPICVIYTVGRLGGPRGGDLARGENWRLAHGTREGRAAGGQPGTSGSGRVLLGLALVGGFTCLWLSWFLFPMLENVGAYYQSATSQLNPLVLLRQADLNVDLSSLLRFKAFRTSAPSFASYWAPSWRLAYDTPLFKVLSAVLVSVVALGVLARWSRVLVRWATALWVCGVVLCLGGSGFFGSLYVWAIVHVPYFGAFRDPTNMWTPLVLVGTTLLFASGSRWLLGVKRICQGRVRRAIVCGMLGAVVMVYGFPMWLGGPMGPVIRGPGWSISRGVTVPPAYEEVRSYLDHQKGWFRVVVLPLSPSGYRWFKWQRGYDGPDVSWLQLGVPTVSSGVEGSGPSASVLSGMVALPLSRQLVLAERLGCRYAVVESDVVSVSGPASLNSLGLQKASSLVGAVKRAGGVSVFRSGAVRVFRLPTSRVGQLVSYSTLVPLGPGSARTLVSWRAVSPTSFTIRISGLEASGEVEIAEAYASQWRARVVSNSSVPSTGTFSGHQATASDAVEPGAYLRHVEADGYANAWLIPARGSETTIEISVQYTERTSEEVGELVSAALVLILAISELARLVARRRRRARLADQGRSLAQTEALGLHREGVL
jgi:hypothetical protein